MSPSLQQEICIVLHDDTIREDALAWAMRTGDPAFDDWDSFTDWLEADPAHAAAYDAIAAAADDGAEAEAARPVADNDDNDEPKDRRVTRRWFSGALVAGLAALVAFGMWQAEGGPTTYSTLPGETLVIALDDGGSIELAGGSKLVLGEDGDHFARLEDGQALFTLHHDASEPFTVAIGEDRLVDIGTVFDVRTGNGELTVAVSQGAVLFNPQGQNVRVDPGEVLTSAAGSSDYEVSSVAPEMIGEWRDGRLTFQQASLSRVATDLSRATGIDFTAAPGNETQSVSGSVLIAPLKDDPQAIGALLGISVRKGKTGWVLDAR